MDPVPTGPKKPKPSSPYLEYSSLGLQLLGAIGIAAWAGYKLDHTLGFKFPFFLLFFVLATFGGMMFLVYRSLRQKGK
jgi:F0F1-type ATP synthase assembly protein I